MPAADPIAPLTDHATIALPAGSIATYGSANAPPVTVATVVAGPKRDVGPAGRTVASSTPADPRWMNQAATASPRAFIATRTCSAWTRPPRSPRRSEHAAGRTVGRVGICMDAGVEIVGLAPHRDRVAGIVDRDARVVLVAHGSAERLHVGERRRRGGGRLRQRKRKQRRGQGGEQAHGRDRSGAASGNWTVVRDHVGALRPGAAARAMRRRSAAPSDVVRAALGWQLRQPLK